MKVPFLALSLAVVVVLAGSGANAQTNPTTAAAPQTGDSSITANRALGEVKVINTAAKQLTVKTDAGSLVTVVLSDSTSFMRVAPGETTLSNATRITFADVAEGDRVMAMGKVSDDRKLVPARTLIVMTKADLAKKQEADRAEWKRRGILGIITALKPETKEITISSRTMAGPQSITIPVSEKVELRRYAPDSIKFADAQAAKFDELKVGDQLRALGERDTAGTTFTAEKVVTGSFKTVAGVITAVDPATGELKINDMQTKQPLTIVVKHDAVLRKFPAAGEMGGGMMMGRPGGGGAGGQAAGSGPGAGAAGPGAGGPGAGGGMRMGGGGGMNVQEMLERLPTIALSEVKVGDTIIVSSTRGADPSRLTAISLISGADTLLNMLAARQPQASGQTTPNPSAGLGNNIPFGIGLP
jgi:Ni2+-binding GTPase involved in maturation of urease and hydrogenase